MIQYTCLFIFVTFMYLKLRKGRESGKINQEYVPRMKRDGKSGKINERNLNKL